MTMTPAGPALPLGRRRLLALGGGALALTACSRTGSSTATTGATAATAAAPSTPPTAATAATTSAASAAGTTAVSAATTATAVAASEVITAYAAADFDALGTCVLLPEATAGPFPLDEQFDRRDVTEDSPGRPLRLGLRVVDDTCMPVAGATVEIWHCDATGDYSAFTDGGGGQDEAEGTTFLRGSQASGDDGIVEFLTVVPGWYRGRAVHIHLRVHLDDAIVLTSQLYFDADQLAAVYAEDAYVDNGLPDTSNESDGIAGDPADEGTLLAMADAETTRGAGSVALLNLGVAS